MKKIIFLSSLLFGFSFTHGQDLNKRYSFAKAYFGLDALLTPQLPESSFLNPQQTLENFNPNAFLTPAINIGATHFWGHADFYVSITTVPLKLGSDPVEHAVRFGALTGMRIYPLKLKDHTLRPFAGYKFAPIRFDQENITEENFRVTRTRSILEIGLGYQTPKRYAYLGYNRVLNPGVGIYLSRSTGTQASFPQHFFTLGVNFTMETTRGAYSEPIRQLDAVLSVKNQYGLFFGIGPSSAFPTADSEYISDLYPFLDDRAMPSIFPDLSIGYHFTKQDFVVAAAFRPMRQKRSAFSFEQDIVRNSFGLEIYKFLFDYHGFAPFLGAGVSREFIRLREQDLDADITDERFNKTTPSLIFGWDIRPARKADIWLLRTNLRYAPSLEIANHDKKLSLQYLEFNFIQLVIYPQRIRAYKKLR